jgi:hypothetical protein
VPLQSGEASTRSGCGGGASDWTRIEILLGNGRVVATPVDVDLVMFAVARRGGGPRVLSLPPTMRVFVATGATDMRKSFQGLVALTASAVM